MRQLIPSRINLQRQNTFEGFIQLQPVDLNGRTSPSRLPVVVPKS
jgi:hypothetical protein